MCSGALRRNKRAADQGNTQGRSAAELTACPGRKRSAAAARCLAVWQTSELRPCDARTEAGPRHLPDLRCAHVQKGVHDGVALGRHAREEAQAAFARGGRPAGRVLCAAGGLSAAALMSAGLRPQPGAVLLYPGRTPVHTARAQALSGEARWPADSTRPVRHAPAPCKRQATRPERRLHRW